VKGRIDLGVSYSSDVEVVKQMLVAIALEEAVVLRDPVPEAYFVSFGASELNMSLFFWVGNYTNLFAVTDRINTLILKRFRENGIEIPYPTTTVLVEKEN
jgi:small-conductance mechanosensitive channel